MSVVVEHFLSRLLTVYGAPKSDNREAYLAEYDRILGKYSAEELAVGAGRLLETHKFRTWPSIAECVNACANLNPAGYAGAVLALEAVLDAAAREVIIAGKHTRTEGIKLIDGVREALRIARTA